jgi:cytochrome c553
VSRRRPQFALVLAGLIGLAGFAPGVAEAQLSPQARAGQEKSRSCMVCHGQLGISNVPNAPHLAGQPAIYLIEQLKAYRSGRRANEVMAVIARPLSDADIDDLAAWYSSIRIEATAP